MQHTWLEFISALRLIHSRTLVVVIIIVVKSIECVGAVPGEVTKTTDHNDMHKMLHGKAWMGRVGIEKITSGGERINRRGNCVASEERERPPYAGPASYSAVTCDSSGVWCVLFAMSCGDPFKPYYVRDISLY